MHTKQGKSHSLFPAQLNLNGNPNTSYAIRGVRQFKIPASWKKWGTMDRAQRVKMINFLYTLTPEHARKVGDIIDTELQRSRSSVDDEVQKNRTMHEMARAMHVISDSDNTAALSKALGRYSRLDLDREHSKLDEEIEVKPYMIELPSFPQNFPRFPKLDE